MEVTALTPNLIINVMTLLANIKQIFLGGVGGAIFVHGPSDNVSPADLVDGCGATWWPHTTTHQMISAHPLLKLFKRHLIHGDELQFVIEMEKG